MLEAEREEQILDTLGQLQNLPGVLNAVLVYHEILHDDDSNDAAAMTDRAIPCSPEETPMNLTRREFASANAAAITRRRPACRSRSAPATW